MSNKKRIGGRPSRYPLEFQRDAVAMVLDEQRSIADVARSIGVNEGTLGKWVVKTRKDREQGSSLSSDERAELAELKKDARMADETADEFDVILEAFRGSFQPLCIKHCEAQRDHARSLAETLGRKN